MCLYMTFITYLTCGYYCLPSLSCPINLVQSSEYRLPMIFQLVQRRDVLNSCSPRPLYWTGELAGPIPLTKQRRPSTWYKAEEKAFN